MDLRFNSGGDLVVARDFFEKLAHEAWADRPGRLFVIVGRCTFSAGLYHAAQMKQLSRAIFVGEPVGDRLDYWAEGGQIVLPKLGCGDLVLERLPPLFAGGTSREPALLRTIERARAGAGCHGATLFR